jgi:hypothetical protein
MNKRPLSVTIIGGIFVIAGAVGLVYHSREFLTYQPFPLNVLWVELVRVVAIIAGVYMLRGSSWARWVALLWLLYHVLLSGFHSWIGMVMHGVLLAVIAYCLFRRPVREYFQRTRERLASV